MCLQAHIRTFGGRLAETILSLRFFIFQYGIIYKLDVQRQNTSLTVTTLIKLNDYCVFPSSYILIQNVIPHLWVSFSCIK